MFPICWACFQAQERRNERMSQQNQSIAEALQKQRAAKTRQEVEVSTRRTDVRTSIRSKQPRTVSLHTASPLFRAGIILSTIFSLSLSPGYACLLCLLERIFSAGLVPLSLAPDSANLSRE